MANPAEQRLARIGASVQASLALYRATFSDRNVGLLLGAGFASEIGDWFNIVALVSLSFHFGEGATGVGGMLAARMLPRLLLQGPAGSLVDRRGGRRLLFVSQLLMALVASAFVLLVRFPQLWLLYLLLILLEAINCVARPAFMVELRDEAPPDQRAAANGALFASMTTAQLVGPPLGGLLLVPFGPAAVFAANAATFLAVAIAVSQLRGGLHLPRRAPHLSGAPPDSNPLLLRDVGYRWLLRRLDLGLYALVCLALALLVQATIALFVVRADDLGLGDGGVGVFYAAVAAGSIAGSVVAGGSPQSAERLSATAVAMALCAAALAAFGGAGTVALAIVALAVAGFMTDFYEVAGLAYFQQSLPSSVYGRFFSVFLMALGAGGVVGALAGPVLETSLGVRVTLVVLAAPALALALLLGVLSRHWQPVLGNGRS